MPIVIMNRRHESRGALPAKRCCGLIEGGTHLVATGQAASLPTRQRQGVMLKTDGVDEAADWGASCRLP